MAGKAKLVSQFLELLATGVLLGFARRGERKRLLEESDRVWHSIDRKQLYQILERLKLQRAIEVIKQGEGIETIRLTNKGKAKALTYRFRNLTLPRKKRWDKKWRLVLFDIQESKKKLRDALRRKLKELGFLEFQKSVFIYPFACRDEINFVINFFNLAECVYYIEAPIDVDSHLRKYFKV